MMMLIIIIWHYDPLWVFAFSANFLQVLLSLAASFQFLTSSFFRSSMTFSCHRCLGFPIGLVPIGFQTCSFLVGFVRSILWICPRHLILCELMNLTISAPSIKLSISMLFRILHTLSIATGPNIFLNICLSKMRRLFSYFAVKVQVSDQCVTTGLIIVLYIFILVFLFKSLDFIIFELHNMLCCQMEPRLLKFSTFSKVKFSIFKCVISFILFLFICVYLVLSSLIFSSY